MHQPYYPMKLLKKLNSFHRPKSLREAMDATMDIKVEHQITQPESQVSVMENCYQEAQLEEPFTTEVQTRSQAQKQGQKHQGSQPQFQNHQYARQKNFQGNQNYNKFMDQASIPSTTRKTTRTMVTEPCTRDKSCLLPVNNLCNS